MPTLSIIRLDNKCAFTYTGEENEITRMLTQCALRDQLLAAAITQSANNIYKIMKENQPDRPDVEKQKEK